jgi:hypothetical protein
VRREGVTPEAFTGEVEDLSTDQGFQFVFACARCGATWRSGFRRHGAITLEGVLDRADDVLGGLFGAARTAMGEVRGPAWQKARGEALSAALLEARKHFACCARCAREVCGRCWDPDTDLCADCRVRPDSVGVAPAEEPAPPEPDERPRCAHCGTPVSGGRYCPVCSQPLA